jgi:uncharacterized membrane protein YeaQ/YmgE (transglycosylase-associated protein family)
MWNLVVFALIGLLAGTAARMLYPGKEPMQILGTLALGAVGGVVGGLISWAYWPEVDSQFHSGNLAVSIIGAFIMIAFWAGVSYARNLSAYTNPSR